MNNHFHLLLETPEANLSRSMQWLGVSYSVWFNRRHDRAGHLFQGRFKAIILEPIVGGRPLRAPQPRAYCRSGIEQIPRRKAWGRFEASTVAFHN